MEKGTTNEWITKYLQGLIPEEEMLSKVRLSGPELEELRFKRYMGQALKEKEALEFQRKLIEKRKPNDSENKVREPRNYYRIALAAALILLMVLLGLYHREVDIDLLTDQYITEMPEIRSTVFRSAQETNSGIMDSVFAMLEEGDTASAQSVLSKLVEAGSLSAAYYSGCLHLARQEWEMSIRDFSLLTEGNHNLYVRDASWYSALAYVKLGDPGKAKVLLSKLMESESPYSEKAELLSSALDQRN